MFRPKYPTAPMPTGAPVPYVFSPTAVQQAHAPSAPACACHHSAPAPVAVQPAAPARFTPGSVAVVVAGGTAAVFVVGTVLVSMLLAVAVTAASLAVCAVVLRSLLNNQHKQR